ncbi:hypothetical protein FISHEDRAFT_29829, partial [Fistulina hepatica ATCC 64428]
LTEQDMGILRALEYKHRSNTSDRAFSMAPYAFPQAPGLSSLKTMRGRLAGLSGVQPVTYDCCINSCCCFVGPHADADSCPYCSEPRYRPNSLRARKKFSYVPLIPRLQAMAQNRDMATAMQYRSLFVHNPDTIVDVFDGQLYRSLLQQHISVGDRTLPDTFFSSKTDVALGISTDGFAPFKRRKKT